MDDLASSLRLIFSLLDPRCTLVFRHAVLVKCCTLYLLTCLYEGFHCTLDQNGELIQGCAFVMWSPSSGTGLVAVEALFHQVRSSEQDLAPCLSSQVDNGSLHGRAQRIQRFDEQASC
jgi:hypothetical protein